jgi:hypothetical protein
MARYRPTLTVLALAPALALAQGAELEFEFDSPFLSKYVWRGLNVVDGPVWQPSVTATYGGWSLGFWGNLELDDTNDYGPGFGSGRGKFTELDSTLAYSATSGEYDWSVGIVRYEFPDTGQERTSEVFATITQSSEWPVTLEVYTDVEAVNGTYANLSVAKAWDTKDEGEFGIGIGVGLCTNGHNAYYFGADKSGLVDIGIGLTYARSLSDTSSLTVYGTYTSLIDKALVPGSGRRDNFVFGVGLTVGF